MQLLSLCEGNMTICPTEAGYVTRGLARGVWEGLRFVIVALLGLFSYPFLTIEGKKIVILPLYKATILIPNSYDCN